MSIATIFPPLTVRARIAYGLPSAPRRRPQVSRSRGSASPFPQTDGRSCLLGDGPRAAHVGVQLRTRHPAVGAQHDVRIEDGEKRSKSPAREAARKASTTAHWPSRSTSGTGAPWTWRRARLASLPGGRRRSTNDRGDLFEWHGEDVVQHEGDPFGRRQGVEDNDQCEPDGIAQQGFLLGIGSLHRTHDRIGDVGLQRHFAARLARSQHVETDPPDDRRQPGPQVVNSRPCRRG